LERDMRVLQVIPTIATGGAERMLATLVRLLGAAGHTVGVVAMHDPDGWSLEAQLRADGATLFFLGQRRRPDVRLIPRFARAMREFAPHVVHTHLQVLKYVLPAALARRCGVVHTVHNLAEREVTRPDRLVQRLAFRAGVVPVAIGEAVAESVRRVYAVTPRRTISNGITVRDYAPPPAAREELRAALGVPPDAPVVLGTARFEPQKNVGALVDAVGAPRLREAGVHLLLAGEGVLRGELGRQVAALGLGARVHFLGQRDDVARLLAAADVFALTSSWEGQPLSVMEAMAAGKPVVATAVGCVPELVPEGTGRLVAPGDGAALERALLELVTDLETARAMGARAERTARERYDAAAMVAAYETLYREVA
jgi:glycosyltransferase involved in cell wall biosynthesis